MNSEYRNNFESPRNWTETVELNWIERNGTTEDIVTTSQRNEVFHQIPRQRLRALTPQRLSRKERQKQVLLAASTTALVMAQYDAFGGLPHKNDKMITADHPYTRQRNDVCLIPNCSSQSHEQSAFDGLSSYRGISWHNDAVQNEITGIFQGDLGNYPRELELKWKSKAFDMDSPHDVLTLNKLNLNRDANESPTQFHLDRRDALHSDLKSECSNSTESEEAYVQMSPDRLETCLPFEHPVLVEAAEDQDSEVPNFPPELNMIRQEFRFNSRVPEKSPENMVECKPGGSLQQQLQQLPRVTQNEVLPPPSKLYGAANCLNFASNCKNIDCGLFQPKGPCVHNGDESNSCQWEQCAMTDDTTESKKLTEIAKRILDELVSTERSYCHSLYVFSEVVAKSVCTKSGVSLKELRSLFPRCLPDLYSMHVKMLEQMEADMRMTGEKYGDPRVVDFTRPPFIVLLDSLERITQKQLDDFDRPSADETQDSLFFILYKRYFSEFTVAMETMRKLTRQSSRFRQTIKRLQEHPECEGFDFSAFLLAPIQRLPRYLLLMKQMIRHFRKLNQTSAQIGNISASEAVNLAERCEKRLHTILVDLDAQLAERRQQPKKKLSTLSQEPSRGLSETRTDLANTNGNHSRLNPPQLIEHNYENARGLWPRVRRAFSDKRSNPKNENITKTTSPRESIIAESIQSCHISSISVEPKVTDNLQPHSYRNSVPIGRYLVTPYYDDDLEESSGIQAVPLGSKAEKLILMKNPLQELISCVTAGTISAAVRRNSRRQTVGAVTAALQNTLPKDKQKHLSLDENQFSIIPNSRESLKSYEKLTVASVLRKEDISFQYIDVTGIDSMTHSHTTQSHSALSNQRQENNKAEVADAPKDLKNPKIVEKRINRMKTFPARQFPFVRLQRRRSEPAAHNFLVIPSAYTNNEVPLTKPKVEDSESLYDCQPHSAEMGISVLSPNCIPSGVGDTYIAQASTRHSKSLSGSMLVTEQDEHAQYDNCSVPSTTTRALSQSLAVSGENNASQTLCRLSLPPIHFVNTDCMNNENAPDLGVLVTKTVSENYWNTPDLDIPKHNLKRTIHSWRSAFKKIFRRRSSKKNDKYATNVKNFKEFATREEYPNLQCEISEATTYSVPSQYIKNESQLSETAKSVFERKEMRTFYVPSTVFVETEALPNRVKDLTEMSHLVFLDEAGNPCFDI